jgi:hypothetical protein
MYGSHDYLKHLLQRIGTFEIVVLRAEIRMHTSLDTHYFSRDIPNQSALANLEPIGAGTAFTNNTNLHHHHHHHHSSHRAPHGVGASAGKLPKGSTPGEEATRGLAASSGGKSLHHGSGDERMYFSFYNLPTDAHTPSMGKKLLFSRWVNKLHPLAELSLSGTMLHIQCDHDVTQLSLGAGRCELYDTRHPHQICAPLALRVAPGDDPTTHEHVQMNRRPSIDEKLIGETRRVYGYSDFNFGFDLLPSDMYLPPDLPVKVSFVLSEATNWITCNVGMDMLDLNIHNLDLVNLISDYFSCYFRFPEYGHPGVQAYDRLTAPYIIPYGGVDTRVFAFRPHISLLKVAKNVQSPALLLETEGGVYFRYTLDTNNTVKMDVNIFSLAVVLVKRYRPPSQYRGIRGSSGSGKGVRTLVEYLNINMSYHFVVGANNLDLKLMVSGPDEGPDDESVNGDHLNESTAVHNTSIRHPRDSTKYVNLQGEQLQLGSSTVPHPHSVYPLISPRTDFTPHSCDIVTSYEDLTFCASLINKFLQYKGSENAEDSDLSGKHSAKSPKHASKVPEPAAHLHARTRSASDATDSSIAAAPATPCSIFSVLVVAGVRLMIVDNVLGLHLPLVQVRLSAYVLVITAFSHNFLHV